MTFEFILLHIIQYSSWPIGIIILAFMFRKQLSKLSNLKIKDYEFSFSNELSEIKKDTTKNTNKELKPKSNNQYKSVSTNFLSQDMIRFSEKSPLSSILHAWGIIENLVLESANEKCDSKFYTASAAIQALFDQSIISHDSYNSFVRLYAFC